MCVEGLVGGVIKQAQGKRDSKVNSQGPVLEADVGAQPLGQMKADRPPGEWPPRRVTSVPDVGPELRSQQGCCWPSLCPSGCGSLHVLLESAPVTPWQRDASVFSLLWLHRPHSPRFTRPWCIWCPSSSSSSSSLEDPGELPAASGLRHQLPSFSPLLPRLGVACGCLSLSLFNLRPRWIPCFSLGHTVGHVGS